MSKELDWLRHYSKRAKTPLWAKRCHLWVGTREFLISALFEKHREARRAA